MDITYDNLSDEQKQFCDLALSGNNIRVEACIGSGKTTAIQTLCNLFPKNKWILYLTYNKLLKVDAKAKITNTNVVVTNYHGFVYPYLQRNGIRCSVSDAIKTFVKNRLSIPRFNILIIDEYQDIELDFAEMLEYIKSTNPKMQIIMVGDMAQKIYDKTTLDVKKWSDEFLGNYKELAFTQCFRLQPELAAKLSRIWNKPIIGVNTDCCVRTMGKDSIVTYLKDKNPNDILCLGSKSGSMMSVLNILETRFPYKFNKKTIYASINNDASDVEPTQNTAIFTTYDSSKGMERPICVVFDWDEAYWKVRNNQTGTNSEILRNIFCVAASRGKKEIIFVQNIAYGRPVNLLSEETLRTPIPTKKLKHAYTNKMFSFKYIEEIEKAYEMLDINLLQPKHEIITINSHDALIDLTPCIQIYQHAIFFKNYNIECDINYEFQQNNQAMPDITDYSIEQKILMLTSLRTKQNRYYNQVSLPLVTPAQRNSLISRLSEQLSPNENVQASTSIQLFDVTIYATCDVIRDDSIWNIEFKRELKPEDYLKNAIESIMFGKKQAVLWNTRTNEIYRIFVSKDQRDAFLKQTYRIITKQQ